MKWELAYFIVKKLRNKGGNNFSAIITHIAVGSIAVGLISILLSVMIFEGFRSEIQDKIFALAGHIEIKKFDLSENQYAHAGISTKSDIYSAAPKLANVRHIQQYSRKAALLKTQDEVMGVMLKGVGADFDTKRFKNQLLSGNLPDFGKEENKNALVLSQQIARKLRLTTGDDVLIYFVQDPPRARKLKVAAIYNTGIEEFDKQIVIGSNALVQQLNQWGDTLTGGFQLFLDDFSKIDHTFKQIHQELDYDLRAEKVTDRYVHLFDWFLMVRQNVIIFLSILLFVACFNIVSILLILIMERVQMIGTLKALGASERQLQQIFFLNGLKILAKGLLIGNAVALIFGLLQHQFKLLPLDPENYYINFVPIDLNWGVFLLINLAVSLLVGLVLLIPLWFIDKISPAQAVKFS